MAAPWGENTLVTEGQMVSQLRVLLGPVADTMVLNELPRAAALTRGGLKGGLRASMRASMRGSVRGSDSGVSRAGASFAIREPGDREGVGVGGVGGMSRRTRLAVAVAEEDRKEEEEREGGKAGRRVGVEGVADAPAVVIPKRGLRIAAPPEDDEGKEVDEEGVQEGGNRRSSKEGKAGVALLERLSPRLSLGEAQGVAATTAAPDDEGQPQGREEQQNGEQGRQSDSAGDAPAPWGSGSGSGAGPGSSGSQQQRRVRSGTSSGRNSRKSTDPGAAPTAAAVDGGAGDEAVEQEGGAGQEGGGDVEELEQQHADAPESEVAAASRAARVSMSFVADDSLAVGGGSSGNASSSPAVAGPEGVGREQEDGEEPMYDGDSPAGRMPSLSFIPHVHGEYRKRVRGVLVEAGRDVVSAVSVAQAVQPPLAALRLPLLPPPRPLPSFR